MVFLLLCLHAQGVDIDNDMLVYACAGLAVDPNSPEAVAAQAAAVAPAEADAAGAKHHHHHHHHRHLLQASSDSLDYRWKVSTNMLQALKGRVHCRGGGLTRVREHSNEAIKSYQQQQTHAASLSPISHP